MNQVMNPIRVILLVILMAVSAVIVTSIGAQADSDKGDWAVWVNDAQEGFVQVSSSGETLQQISVPFTDTDQPYWYTAISADGQYLAYGEQTGEAEGDLNQFPAQIVIHNVGEDQMVATYPLAPTADATLTSQELFNAATDSLTFSEDGNHVAFGYAYRSDPEAPNAYQWEIVVLDIAQPAPAPSYTLSSAEASAVLDIQGDALYNVRYLQFDDAEVQFMLWPVFVHEELTPVIARWNFQTGDLEVVEMGDAAGSIIGDIDGDLMLTALPAPDQPENDAAGSTIYNRVMLVDTVSGEQQTLFETEEGTVNQFQFVQNDEHVLLYVSGEEMEETSLVIVDREGNIVQTFEDIPYSQFLSTPDGFLYNNEAGDLISVNLLDGGEETPLRSATNVHTVVAVTMLAE